MEFDFLTILNRGKKIWKIWEKYDHWLILVIFPNIWKIMSQYMFQTTNQDPNGLPGSPRMPASIMITSPGSEARNEVRTPKKSPSTATVRATPTMR